MIAAGFILILSSPMMIEFAYQERGYLAFGGEYIAMAAMIGYGIYLIMQGAKLCRK